MNYRYCFFDLDGTLTDSSPGITASVAYALRKSGIEPPPAAELLRFIGPPLLRAFSEFYGMSEEDAGRAVAFYREFYPTQGIFNSTVYEGIESLLERLKASGIVCVLATCKPQIYAERILSHFGLAPYFSFVSGPELDGTRGEKSAVIAHAIEQLRIRDRNEILMIGDRGDDVRGAMSNRISTVGALWGFGTLQELSDAGAVACFPSPQALEAWFFS